MRSILTALGVIIGIIAVTLMGSAIGGIEIGFERSLSVIGDDILYVEKWPWHNVDDWWNYRNRRRIEPQYAEQLKRLIARDAEFAAGHRRADAEHQSQRQVRRQRGAAASSRRGRRTSSW